MSTGKIFYDPACTLAVQQYGDPNNGFRGGRPWAAGGNWWMNDDYEQRADIGSNVSGGSDRQVNINRDPGGAAFISDRSDFGWSPDGTRSWADWTHHSGYNVLYVDGSVHFVGLKGIGGQTPDPNVANSTNLTIPRYIEAMNIKSFKNNPRKLENFFYYKLDRQHPRSGS